MLDEEPTPGGLVPVPAVRAGKFHTAHKLSLMAHSPKHYTQMGRLVADAGKRDWDELIAEYGAQLMEGLGVMGTRGKHVNALQHLMGYLKNHLSSEDKQELLGLIEDYRQGLSTSNRTSLGGNCRSRCHLWWGGFCQGAPSGRGPEPLPGARMGACAERSVGTPAGVPAPVPQGADVAEPRVDPW
jgi:hypothetical protein